MPFINEYRSVLSRINQAMPLPVIQQILLPKPNESDEIKDNFGFVILANGTVGPFYTCLENSLEWLQNHQQEFLGKSPILVAEQLTGTDIPLSALALGTYNAISQHVMQTAGYDPSLHEKKSDTTCDDAHIGMVGFFRPLIERYLDQGRKITVIEQQPERVPADLPIQLYTTPESLAQCDYVLCTASTLINNTIDSIVDAVVDPSRLNIIGPSASGLPDPLFNLGIGSSGGFIVKDLESLITSVTQGESWGSAGQKYQLSQDTYPGLDKLLSRITQSEAAS